MQFLLFNLERTKYSVCLVEKAPAATLFGSDKVRQISDIYN